MVDELFFLIDGQYRSDPKEDFGIKIQFIDPGAVFVSFENDATFTGGGYEYIYQQAQNYCARLSVEIYYVCNGNRKELLGSGYILISDCVFNKDKCQVKTKILDAGFQTRINNNKAIQIFSNAPESKNGVTIVEPYTTMPYQQYATLFTPSTSTVITPEKKAFGWSVYNAMLLSTNFMADNEIGFKSDYFLSGEGKKLFVTSGQSIRAGDASPFKYSFEQLYLALNSKLDLAFGFELINGQLTLRVEQRSFFRGNPPSITLLDVPNIISRFDKEKIYSRVSAGSDEYLEEWQGNNNEGHLSFPQITFIGFKKEEFAICGDCNMDRLLDLTTRVVIFDTNIIENILIYQDQAYDQNPIIIEWEDYSGTADTFIGTAAQHEDILGIGSWQYNPSLTNNNQIENSIADIPCDVSNPYQGYDADLTLFQGNSDFPDFERTFSETPQFFSDVFFPGVLTYLPFQVEITDSGGNYTPIPTVSPFGSRYTCPAPGIYTFFTRIKKNEGETSSTDVFSQRIVFVRSLPDGTVIERRFQTQQNLFVALPACAEATDTFFVNQGDIVTVDIEIWVNLDLSGLPPGSSVTDEYDFSSGDVGLCDGQPVTFSGSGEPIQGGQVVQAQPDLYRPAIETFTYPLTFEQVIALITQTTLSIAYTDSLDELTVKQGDILNITIDSIGKNIAKFELKTSSI